ncbi:MAG: hypothetical protein HPY62_13375 [Bacteroidales bacterium]|nr:hypothetical protein [Bacteroidales bacterium]
MKALYYLFIVMLTAGISSCATTVKFPVSQIAPAADGTVKVKKDKNNNYLIAVNVKYLANPDRLTPPRSVYVVWAETEEGITKNIGRLVSNRSNKGSMKTSTPFNPVRIFITAEDEGTVTFPGRQELFRTEKFRVKAFKLF